MGMFDKLLANLKASRKIIVLTEGTDARILSAAARLLEEDLMDVILCGNVEDVKAAAAEGGFDISKATILDPLTYPEMDALVDQMVELRRGKQTPEECRDLLTKSNYFGTMLVKAGKADALLGGTTYSTADTVRPALQIIKCKKGSNLVSSSFILFRTKDGEEEKIAMGDCAINLAYTDRLD
ncbi:MAG: phosphate acetyltransferase, partial [Clostridia bacterium]|nr:phosphate acetyltransferase [Clostridia bacterium]